MKAVTTLNYNTSDALERSNTNRVSNETALIADVVLGAMKSITTYSGNEGEEKAQVTYNYNYDVDAIKTATGFFYNPSDALESSNTNRVSNETALIADVVLGAMKSITTYSGNEGEEKAQVTYNYNYDGDAIKTVTGFFYNTSDALESSNTNRVSNETALMADVVLGAMKSITTYSGNEGEEQAQVTY